MTTNPDRTDSPARATPDAPPGVDPARPMPPAARRGRPERTHPGATAVDEYAWLAAKDDPETIAYLEAENAYTAAMTEGQAGLRETIFGEIRGRTKETDLSVPARKGDWWYYTRTVEGKQYPLHCRCAALPGQSTPPSVDGDGPLPGEEVLLDGNELAGDAAFFSLGAFSVSPDGSLLAYSTDFAGAERYTLRVKHLVTGETFPDEIPDTHYGCAWSSGGSALFYTTADAAWRPFRVWRHLVGTPVADDAIVAEESDERYWVGVGLTRSESYLRITASSKLTSEVWLLDSTEPAAQPRVVLPRRQGVEYPVEHQAGPGRPARGRGGRGAGGPWWPRQAGGGLLFGSGGAPRPAPGGGGGGGGAPGPWAAPVGATRPPAHTATPRLLGGAAFAGLLVIPSR